MRMYLLGTMYVQQHSSDLNVFDNFNKKGKTFRNDELLSNILHEIRIILYHDDFGVSNLLGNKINIKHPHSTLCFGEYSCKIWVKIKGHPVS